MDPLILSISFVSGYAVRLIGLPPLVGFLAAGFVLHGFFGVQAGAALQFIADTGVTLLLFTIGLKLKIKGLLKAEIWAGASLHMLITVALFSLFVWGAAAAGLSGFAGMSLTTSLLVAFALSFSSTVFAVKILEEKGEMSALHGQTAIGILIMQDVLAVVFLTASTGKIPSPWAIALIALLLAVRPLLLKLMDSCGHGELLILFGFFIALVAGAGSFDMVFLKADLGALFVGMLLAGHPKASELSKSLFGFKEIFLVGFFLTIGLGGTPTFQDFGIALLLTVFMPLKVALFFVLLCSMFKLRARSSLLTSFSLANYSEFGLIVGAVGVANGWLANEWLVIIAISLSMTFILASPLNSCAAKIYVKWQDFLGRFETEDRHAEEQLIDPGEATVCIMGMGKVGTAAYDYLSSCDGVSLFALDRDEQTTAHHQQKGRNVVCRDAGDLGFWSAMAEVRKHRPSKISMVLLAMRNHKINMFVAEQLISNGFKGKIAAAAVYDDEVKELKEHGVDLAFNFFAEAGVGFAEKVYENIDKSQTKR